ncbi:MAG: alpha-amylase family glycosyl hydrolase [Alphaproteobacteria bacterium]|nr:alpha-amylase [Rhodospirillaceae bacterium]MBT6510333.1 alpha-amylase [Rhodospirillaceae bacterium]MBT7613680.1 alpha-amylase [Rhodospirillaceae bacterium]MDG2482590.1 alpha-amylase family glycosyl hydrolase [Alphaproteobacteria bacterium]
MRTCGNIIELDEDESSAPRRWRWSAGQPALVRFGIRRSCGEDAGGLLRFRFGSGVHDSVSWQVVTAVPDSVSLGPLHSHFAFFRAKVQPPTGEASCTYQPGWSGADGTQHWEPLQRLLVFSRLPTQIVDVTAEVVGYSDGSPVTGPPPALAMHPVDGNWRSRFAYNAIIDRFGQDESEHKLFSLVPTDRRDTHQAHGGTLNGVCDRLDYLAELGVGVLMLSPVYVNAASGYHGYHPIDLLAVEPRLGTIDDLQRLVSQAHGRDIAVTLDVNVNHLAPLINWRVEDDGYRGAFRFDEGDDDSLPIYPEELRHIGMFHHPGHDGDEVSGRLFGFLEDWRTELDLVRDALVRHLKFWISQTDVDGFRYDAVRHVELDFWQTCVPEIRRYAHAIGKTGFRQYGEHSSANSDTVGSFSKGAGFEGMVGYPLYYRFRDLIQGKDGALQALRNEIEQACFAYRDSRDNLAFLENHDVDRLLGLLGDRPEDSKQDCAIALLAVLLSGPWTPCLYYGQEQGFAGRLMQWQAADGRWITDDAYVREDMAANPDCTWRHGPLNQPRHDAFDVQNPLFAAISALAGLRRNLAALSRGNYRPLPAEWNDTLAFMMASDRQTVLVAANPFGEQDKSSITVPSAGPETGDDTSREPVLHFQHGGVRIEQTAQTITLELDPGSACIVELQER